jgi:cysteine desulfurase
MAIFGAVRVAAGVAVCSAIEHHAILHPVEALHGRIVGVDARASSISRRSRRRSTTR